MKSLKFLFAIVALVTITESTFAQISIGINLPGRRPAPAPRYPGPGPRPYPVPYPAPYPGPRYPAPRPYPTPAPYPVQQVCFYEDDNFQGRSYCVYPGQEIANFKDIGFNDRVSSIAIPRGVVLTVYQDAYYTGRRLTLQSDVYSVRAYNDAYFNWNDQISSVSFGY